MHGNQVWCTRWMPHFVDDLSIYKFSQLLLYEELKHWMNFPQILMKWLGPFLNRYYMLDDSRVICPEFIIRPRNSTACTSGWRLSASTKINILRIFSDPKLICSCDKVELWVLALTSPQKRLCRSYNFSNETTPLGMRLPLLVLTTSCSAFRAHPYRSLCLWIRQRSP